jgi:hypothetical protein
LEGCTPIVPTSEKSGTYDSADKRLADSLADLAQNDPDLAGVIRAWPELPDGIKAGIMAMVKAAKPGT